MTTQPEVNQGPALVTLTQRGCDLARTLRSHLPGSSVHGLQGRADGADETFAATAKHLRNLFSSGRPVIGFCAAGILIRALAPVVGNKKTEPAVIAVSEDGAFVVPLLGGHRGANRLATIIARVTGGAAAITTAGEVRFGFGLDDPPPGWRVANRNGAKPVAAALLAGDPVALRVEAGDPSWLTDSDAVFSDNGKESIRITDKIVSDSDHALVMHPAVLAVGVGCERDTEPDELIKLVRGTLQDAGLSPLSVACVCSLDLKEDEAAVHAAAASLGVSARFFTAAELEAQTQRLANPSDAVFKAVGCHGVAEGAALAAVGGSGTLRVEKKTSARATVAVARAPASLDPFGIGRARGVLRVVGIGPGTADWRTPEATRALRAASDVVGYGLYLDLVADEITGKARHASNLSQEEDRVRTALDLAAEGRTVALICSGDAGIYALASLCFELLDRDDNGAWNRLDISVVPGVSAFQAAAARIGAPMGHDFCAVSLSDLLTPWADIEKRLQAAGAGDFVTALYNPVSRRRRVHLKTARDIFLKHRPAATPVVLARNLGRAEETIRVIALSDLTPDQVDMLTLVVVGSSRTRVVTRGQSQWVYTPRGYGDKLDGKN